MNRGSESEGTAKTATNKQYQELLITRPLNQLHNAKYSGNILLTAIKLAKITGSVPQSLLQGLLHELQVRVG